jgi:hypothetical protein
MILSLGLLVITVAARAATYDVTTDAQLAAVPWLTLAAGDEVLIHWKSEPYRVKIGLRVRGTEASPIKITGVVGPSGELPVLSGSEAVTPQQFIDYNGGSGFFDEYTEGLSAFFIRRGYLDNYGYRSGYLVLENLRFTGSNEGNYFYNQAGQRVRYWDGASGIWAIVDHLTVRHCQIDDSGNGFFTQGAGDEDHLSRDILFEYNRVFNNGNAWNASRIDREHNIYSQAGTRMIFQYNYIGPVRAGTGGSSLKDRSAGLIVRYNWVDASARALDLVEPEDSSPILINEPGYHETFVYGNIIVNNLDNSPYSTNIVHFGADNDASTAKMGPHHFYNNTVVVTGSGANKEYRVCMIDIGTGYDTDQAINNAIVADIRNNIFYWNPAVMDSGAEKGLLRYFGTANVDGTNWISSGWQNGRTGFVGTVNVNGTLLTGTAPGFADEAGRDFSLTAGSPALDQSTALPVSLLPLVNMYKPDADGVARALVGSAMDLGAFEGNGAGAGHVVDPSPTTDTTAPSVPGNLRSVAVSSTAVSLAWNASMDNVGVTGYRVYRGATLAGSPTGTTFIDNSGLTPSTSYSYTVRAVDAAGNQSTASTALAVATSAGSGPIVNPTPSATITTETIIFPNPVVGIDPTIRAFVGEADTLEVTIFDAAGSVIHSERLTSVPTGMAGGSPYHDYVWTGRPASGIYYAVIHGKQGGDTIRGRAKFIVVK